MVVKWKFLDIFIIFTLFSVFHNFDISLNFIGRFFLELYHIFMTLFFFFFFFLFLTSSKTPKIVLKHAKSWLENTDAFLQKYFKTAIRHKQFFFQSLGVLVFLLRFLSFCHVFFIHWRVANFLYDDG